MARLGTDRLGMQQPTYLLGYRPRYHLHNMLPMLPTTTHAATYYYPCYYCTPRVTTTARLAKGIYTRVRVTFACSSGATYNADFLLPTSMLPMYSLGTLACSSQGYLYEG